MRFPFPDRPKLWGVAVSHYQVEGSDVCDWTDWEGGERTRGGPCGDAVGSWSRYEQDGDLAKAAGANSFRFSVSWSRVEPRPGEFDDAALTRYVRFVDHLRAIGVEPVVTLFHYTHPSWFHRDSPWTSTRSVERFGRFAGKVAEAFGERVRMYVPLNEPLVFLLAGYLDGQIPPGIADPNTIPVVFDHLLLGHIAAAAAIRRQNPGAAIGTAHNMMSFAPERRWHPLDRLIASIAHDCYNVGMIEAFATGRWKFLLPPATRVAGTRPDLPGSIDFFGVNFYSRLHIRCPGRERWIGDFAYRDRSGLGLTDNGWEVVPTEIASMLREASAAEKPLVITENGLADGEDRMRAAFLDAHVRHIGQSHVPVHGYFHWSLLDNYEWLDGFGPKFGLYAVDRRTGERRPRPSIARFKALGEEFLAASR